MGRWKGSLTVEAALIVPIVIWVIFWLMQMSFVLYHYAVLQSISERGIELAQGSWDNTQKHFETGALSRSKDFTGEPLYRDLSEGWNSQQEVRLKQWVQGAIYKDPLLTLYTRGARRPLSIEVQSHRSFTGGPTVAITVVDSRGSMFSALRKALGYEAFGAVHAQSQGQIQDPAEVIRNLDWGLELIQTASEKAPDHPVVQCLNRIQEMKQKVLDYLK